MAASLLDVLSGQQPASTLPAAAGADTEQSAAAARLLRARTGLADAMGGGTPRASSLGEQSAASAGGAQIREAAAQAAPQQMAVADKANQLADQRASDTADTTLRLQQIRQKAAESTSNLVAEYKRASAAMDSRSRDAAAEGLAQTARLASDKYVQELDYRGTIERLGDQSRFRLAALQASLGNQTELLDKMVANQDWLNASDAEKRKALADMDLDTALAVAARAVDSSNTTAEYASIGQGVSGAAQGYKAYQDYTKAKPTSPTPSEPDSSGT